MSPQLKAALLAAVHPTEVDLEQLQRCRVRGPARRPRGSAGDAADAQRDGLRGRRAQCRDLGRAEHHRLVGVDQQALGMLITRTHTTSTSILISSDYLALRQAIVTALRPYPEAAAAVGAALAELELAAAEDITESKTPLLLEAAPC